MGHQTTTYVKKQSENKTSEQNTEKHTQFRHNLLKQCFMPCFIEKSFGILKSKLCVYLYEKDKNTTIVRKITL